MKVSIIVPVYNVEEYLRKCLDSLVNQTYQNIEIIIVNDGTKDNSQSIIDEYKKKFSKLINSYMKENGGLASARNYGIDKATGEYIMFVDSDDYIDTNMVEKLVRTASKKYSDIVVSNFYRVEDDKTIEVKTFGIISDNVYKNYILNCSGACWQLIKKELFTKNNLRFLEKHFYEDIAVIPALGMYAKKIDYIEDYLYYYVIRSGSIMNQVKYKKSFEDIFDSLDTLRNSFISNNKYDLYKDEIEYIYIEHLLHAASLRFFKFKKYEELDRIAKIIKEEFPKWKKNRYFKNTNIKYRIVCTLFYKKYYWLLKIILKESE